MSVRVLRGVGATAALLFLVVAFTPVVNLASFWLVPSHGGTEAAEAIVVLGAGGVTPQGMLSQTSLLGTIDGILLYRKGAAPLIVFSGSSNGVRDEATVRADLARECGLPQSAILTSSLARTTREEAVRIQSLLTSRGIRKVMLVADGPGMLRAMQTFERLGFVVVPQPSSAGLELGGGAEDRLNLLRQVTIELLARAYYRLAGFL
jgi:uncharacterized SAM-binding protein YcdF (DUF218 family)